MDQNIAQTLRYLARLINQHTARTNAAEGSATLRKRRHDQEHVDEHLRGPLLTFPIGETKKGERGEPEPNTICEHEWALIHVKDTWSGPMRLSGCVLCHANLREW